jgi:hypothetical protein
MISFTSTSAGCSIANAIARAIASGAMALKKKAIEGTLNVR